MFNRAMVNRLSVLICVLAALSLAGCKKGGPPVTLNSVPFELPQGWIKAEVADKGISVAMPAGWTTLQAMLAEAESQQPVAVPSGSGSDAQMAEQLNQITKQMGQADAEEIKALIADKEKQGVYLYCPCRSVRFIPGEEETRFSIEKQSPGGSVQIQEVVDKINESLRNEDPAVAVDLPIGKAMKVHSLVTNKDGGEVTRYYYGLANGGDYYIVRFVTEEKTFGLEATADQIMKTLRIDK
jgi:hypothetical protein